MIEKIMKAIKSGNKKRGRNITVGAVVGMLLSYTAIMGENLVYVSGLEIRKDASGEIKFSKDTITFDPNDPEDINNPYTENTLIQEGEKNTYTNNSTISVANEEGNVIGVRIEDNRVGKKEMNFVNNGIIVGIGTDNSSFVQGVKLSGSGLINSGIIAGIGTDNKSGVFGVYYEISRFPIINSGIITVTNGNNGNSCTGMYSPNYYPEKIINSGIVAANAVNRSTGIYPPYSGTKEVINSGTVTATSKTNTEYSGIGIQLEDVKKIAILNSGVIYGKKNAITIWFSKIQNSNNYGLLIAGNGSGIVGALSSDIISIVAYNDAGGENKIKNYGLAFTTDSSGSYKNYDDSTSNFGLTHVDKNINGTIYDIINVGADVDVSLNGTKAITNWKSLGIKNGKLYSDANNITSSEISGFSLSKQYILNGIEDTLKVSGTGNELNNSIINAYKTAVKFDNTGGNLSLTGTTVNGEVDGSDVVVGSSNSDNLTLQGGSIINGNIAMGAGDDILNIKNEIQINGTLDGGDAKDTLNFGQNGTSKTRVASNSDEIRIQHNIFGFENINIDTNVTFYEKTIDTYGKMVDLKITDVEKVKIGTDGTLTLKVNSDVTLTDPVSGEKKIKGHALYTSTGIPAITSEGGRLLLALNKLGDKNIVSFGTTTLESSLNNKTLGTTSKLHTVEKINDHEVIINAKSDLPDISLPEYLEYKQLNKIYHGILSVEDLIENFNVDDEGLVLFLDYLNNIYAGNPYSYSSELSRKSAGMFRDIVVDNIFRPETNKWMIYGGLAHVDGGTKDTYYGKGYYTTDIGSSDMDADTKITGAYMLGEYGVSDTLTSGVVIGGNKLKSNLSNGSKVDGSAMYLGAYAKKYVGNLKITAGAGFQYGDYDADRMAVNRVASDETKAVMKYSDNYNDITYDIYLN